MAPENDAAEDMVEQLVHQFSDPFAFYRELIQNGIDAGSSRIEVTLRFEPGRTKGLATASVQDWGEGMNRDVIENYLLTKFRSSKENDLTKIGKFGIGFMSVFSPGPELVVVDTGRDGEYWRLLFHADRGYELLRGPEPVEGTRITLHKEMSARDYSDFVRRSRESIERWCRHAEAEVAFAAGGDDGLPPGAPEALRQPLELDAPFQVEHREEGTLIIAGPARKDPPDCGLYNRGLTLFESREAFFPGVTFKIVSRYLEHTLTRDNVRRDRHFDRAMALVKQLVEGPLLAKLPEELEKAAAARDGWDDYAVLLAYASGRLPPDQLWFRRASGGAVKGSEVRRSIAKAGALLFAAPSDSSLVTVLEQGGLVVLHWEPDSPALALARSSLKAPKLLFAAEAYCLARPEPATDAAKLLCSALDGLLEAGGARTREVALVSLQGAGQDRLSVCLPALASPVLADAAFVSPFERGAPPVLCLNSADPRIASALALARHSPRLAALFTYRLLATTFGALDETADWKVTELSLTR
jgi:molecular chaperone HtpG